MLLTALYMLCVPFGFLFLVHYVIVRSSKKKNVSKVQSVTSTEKDNIRALSQLDRDKQLYHQLQNLEHYPQALLDGYNRLLSLFDATIDTARASSSPTLLTAVPTYSSEKLTEFLNRDYDDVSKRYQAYLERRKTGGARELFPDFEYARYWLRTAAPVKYVDGAWLGGIHRITTSPDYRSMTKTMWQVLSEEFGDGDIKKNHVWVYRELLKSIDADDIGTGDSKEFISSSKNVNHDGRVWTAAVAQLCISLFPERFLPEILGFNLSYESLPLHLLITVHELRELNIDPYYFVLHISIDNNHSGHAAMGMNAVTAYMESLPVEQRSVAWKRVQAGFTLASELPTTPAPRSELDIAVEDVFNRKTRTAHPLHLSCPAKIGGRTGKKLSDWLDPKLYTMHSLAFLRALADSRWIVRGQSDQSKLVSEMKWGGRMFGAFTTDEVSIVESWIQELSCTDRSAMRTQSYETFIGLETTPPNIAPTHTLNEMVSRPSAPRERIPFTEFFSRSAQNKSQAIRSLLAVSSVPFEYVPSLPAKCASTYGMTAIRCLRALYGFLPDSDVCAGMHEVIDNASSSSVVDIARISLSEIDECLRDFVDALLCLAAFPEQNEPVLVGLQSGFVHYVFDACQHLPDLSINDRTKLGQIRQRCQLAIDDLVKERMNNEEWIADLIRAETVVKNLVWTIMH